MKIGPDGSLCRITSSSKDCENNMKIVKVSEDESQKSDIPPYKLILIGEEEKGFDSLSEKSDEEMFEIENRDIELSVETFENAKDNEKNAVEEVHKHTNGDSMRKPLNKKYKPNQRKRNRNNYNFSGTRNFSAGNIGNSYNNPIPINEIEPWLNPSQILNPISNFSYPVPNYYYPPVMEPHLNTSVNSSIDGSNMYGLLGDSPYSPFSPNFQSGNQSNHFGRGREYWNKPFSRNYKRPAQNTPNSNHSGHEKYYHQNKKWKNKRNRKSFWNRNQNESQRGRRNNNGHFDYRN